MPRGMLPTAETVLKSYVAPGKIGARNCLPRTSDFRNMQQNNIAIFKTCSSTIALTALTTPLQIDVDSGEDAPRMSRLQICNGIPRGIQGGRNLQQVKLHLLNPKPHHRYSKAVKLLNALMGCHSSRAPLPEEFRAAVGTWKGAINSEGATVTFVLFGDGSFFYGKQSKHSSVSTQGPINKWSGSGTFNSKLCCCSSHFELENPVDEEEGLTMVVNGVKLSYAGLPSVPSTQSSNQSF